MWPRAGLFPPVRQPVLNDGLKPRDFSEDLGQLASRDDPWRNVVQVVSFLAANIEVGGKGRESVRVRGFQGQKRVEVPAALRFDPVARGSHDRCRQSACGVVRPIESPVIGDGFNESVGEGLLRELCQRLDLLVSRRFADYPALVQQSLPCHRRFPR